MTSAFTVRLPVQTLEVEVENLIRVGKGVPDIYFAFRFGAKLTIFGVTNGVARAKIQIEVSNSCGRLTIKRLEIYF